MKAHRITIAGWFTVKPADRDEVVEAHQDVVRRARQHSGCIDLAISPDPIDRARINMFELWSSKAALDDWRAVANPPRDFTIMRSDVRKHVIQQSGGPFSELATSE